MVRMGPRSLLEPLTNYLFPLFLIEILGIGIVYCRCYSFVEEQQLLLSCGRTAAVIPLWDVAEGQQFTCTEN